MIHRHDLLARRRSRRGFAARAASLLGGLVAVCSSSTVQGRVLPLPPQPRRSLDPPWFRTGGAAPPPPPVRDGAPPRATPQRGRGNVHPAVHGVRGAVTGPLFPRADEPRGHTRPARRYVVRPGDSLWAVAGSILRTRDAARIAAWWPALYELNRDRVGADPDLIHPGTVLRIPPAPRS